MALDYSRQRLRENIEQQQPPYFFIDKEVLIRCWEKICPLLKIDSLLPRLIGYGFLTNDEISTLNNYMYPPGQKKTILYQNVITSDEKAHLLYMCVYDDRIEHLGHDEAREILEDTAREMNKTPPAYLQQRGQPGDDGGRGGGRDDRRHGGGGGRDDDRGGYGGGGGRDDGRGGYGGRGGRDDSRGGYGGGRGGYGGDGGRHGGGEEGRGQRQDDFRVQRRNDSRNPQQVDPDSERGHRREDFREPHQGGEDGRRHEYGEQRGRRPEQIAQGDDEENPTGGQSLPPVPSLPHAPQQESEVAQEGSFVVAHGLSPSSAYANITRSPQTAREIRSTESRVQCKFTDDGPTAIGVQENREKSPACANNFLPQGRPELVQGNFDGGSVELDETAPEIRSARGERVQASLKKREPECSKLMDEVMEMVNTCDPTVEDKLRNRGVSLVRLGRQDYKSAQDLAKQVAKFVVASLNSRCSPTKGRSVLLAGIESSSSNHDLLITGLGKDCERNPNALHRLVIEQLKDTIFVKSHDAEAREIHFPCTDLIQSHVIFKRLPQPCCKISHDRSRKSNTDQAPSSERHVLAVTSCPDVSLCSDKLFMVRCRQSGKSTVYKMSHDRMCETPENEIRELHHSIASIQLTTDKMKS